MAQLTPYSQSTQEISFKMYSFESMGHWTNSNILCTVTDGPFRHVNMPRCMFDPKKKNPYWPELVWYFLLTSHLLLSLAYIFHLLSKFLLDSRFGKSTYISMISNSVTHLWSYTNSAIANIAGNSTPISSESPSKCQCFMMFSESHNDRHRRPRGRRSPQGSRQRRTDRR